MTESSIVSRLTSGVALQPELSNEIWEGAFKQSALTQLATNVPLPGSGVKYQALGDIGAADWVDEGGVKGVDKPTFSSKTMKPYKLARIIVVSEEFARDASALWSRIQTRASQAIAQAIDETFLTGVKALPGADDVATLADAQQVSIGGGKYKDFLKVATTVMEADGDFNGVALSRKGEAALLSATDTNGRPLLVPSVGSTDLGNFFGARIVKSPWGYVAGKEAVTGGDNPTPATPAVLGVAGDWSQALYGTVQGIRMKLSDSATVKIDGENVSLWQHNLLGFLVEAEVGFQVRDKSKFAVITE